MWVSPFVLSNDKKNDVVDLSAFSFFVGPRTHVRGFAFYGRRTVRCICLHFFPLPSTTGKSLVRLSSVVGPDPIPDNSGTGEHRMEKRQNWEDFFDDVLYMTSLW